MIRVRIPTWALSDNMTALLKINQGTAEKLLKWTDIKPTQSRNLGSKELTVEIEDDEVVIEKHIEDYREFLELSDLNGSFGVWVELTKESIQKLKSILKEY